MRRASLAFAAVLVPITGLSTAASAEDEPDVSTAADGTVTYVDEALAGEDTERVRGELRVAIVEPLTPDSGTEPERAYAVETADGDVVPIDLEVEQEVGPGTVVAELVASPGLESALDGEPAQEVEVRSARVQTAEVAAVAAPSSHRAYVAVVTNSGGGLAPSGTIEADVDDGLRWWVEESSGQITSFARVGATKRYQTTRPDKCGLTNPNALWSEASGQFPGVNFGLAGNHLVVVVGPDCGAGGVAGVGTLGSSLADDGAVTVVDDRAIFEHTLEHEIGHNVGLEHANLDVGPTCAIDEYFNVYSVMGFALGKTETTGFTTPTLDSVYRGQLGLTTGAEITQVTGPTTVTLAQRGAASGTRGVRVVDPASGDTVWVEWRGGGGRDAGAFYTGTNFFQEKDGRRTRFPAGVTVTRQGTDPRDRSTILLGRRTGSSSAAPCVGGDVSGSYAQGQVATVGSVTVSVDSIGSSGATVTVSPQEPQTLQSATPSVVGTQKVGVRSTAATGTWTAGTSFTYQWRANGTPIAGATASTFVPTAGQLGKRLSVVVTGRKTGFTSAEQASPERTAVAAGTLSSSTPTISGTRKVGKTLTAKPGTWTSGTAFTYRWYSNGKFVSGATKKTFKPTSSYRGKRISVKVAGTKTGYTPLGKLSAKTGAIAK